MRLPTWVFSAPLEIHPATYTAALCSGSTALKTVQAANLRPGSVVVIVGIAGAIGHLAGMIAKNVYKAHVIGVDFAWKSKSLSSDADRIYDHFVAFPSTSDKDWLVYFEQLSRQCGAERDRHCLPRMADSLIVTTSSAAAFQKMENYVCDGGIIVCVG
jgi:propanol-preferring alcohol dehydrogenase